METDMNNAGPWSQADLPWDSLIDTFPFLTNQAYRALSIQLDFFRNMSTMNLPIPQDADGKENLTAILGKANLVNELVSSLTHSSELLIELKEMEYDEVINARRNEVGSMIDEASDNIKKVISIQTRELERGLGQQNAEIQEQERRAEQERLFQQRISGMPHVQLPVLQQSHAPQQNILSEQIPGLHHASVPPAGPQGYNPVSLNNPVPVRPQAPAHSQLPTHIQAPGHGQLPSHIQAPAHPLPQPVPIQRQDSVYTETSTTSSDDTEIRRMLAKELKRQKKRDRATKRMAKMKRERDRGDFCKRCGRC
ncbi:hypothetical protein FAGAP_5086 [Fusarium agapanthi]|uniref:Uncharacterized protein n=1 Tax=Fusarium agapanthi TaxID=1803897 RepID=A0A9P5BA28_9HYPO|nr:hypothetical protein FAGAP_5086 [Fusarium agapanthi]